MEEIKKLRKRYCSSALAIAIITGFILIVLDLAPIGKGIILGTLFSIFNFILMSQALPGLVSESKKTAAFRGLRSILPRYFFMAIALFLGIKFEAFEFFAVAGGLFAVQIVIFADHVIFSRGAV